MLRANKVKGITRDKQNVINDQIGNALVRLVRNFDNSNISSIPPPGETSNKNRFGEELPADEYTTITNDIVRISSIKDIGSQNRYVNS